MSICLQMITCAKKENSLKRLSSTTHYKYHGKLRISTTYYTKISIHAPNHIHMNPQTKRVNSIIKSRNYSPTKRVSEPFSHRFFAN